jgi:hypothetical protein
MKNIENFLKEKTFNELKIESLYEFIFLMNSRKTNLKNEDVCKFILFINYITFKKPEDRKVKIPEKFKPFIIKFKKVYNITNSKIKFGYSILNKCKKFRNIKYVKVIKLRPFFIENVGLGLNNNFNNLLKFAYIKKKVRFSKNTNKRYNTNGFKNGDEEILLTFEKKVNWFKFFKKLKSFKVNKTSGFKMFEKFVYVMSTTFNLNFCNPSPYGLQYILYLFNYRYLIKNGDYVIGNLPHFRNVFIKNIWLNTNNTFCLKMGRDNLVEKIKRKINEFDKKNPYYSKRKVKKKVKKKK